MSRAKASIPKYVLGLMHPQTQVYINKVSITDLTTSDICKNPICRAKNASAPFSLGALKAAHQTARSHHLIGKVNRGIFFQGRKIKARNFMNPTAQAEGCRFPP